MRALSCATFATVALAGFASSPAQAEVPAPWWGLSAGERPANLHAGVATSEVQELNASPGEVFGFRGIWFELKVGGRTVGTFGTEQIGAILGLPEPTAENVQTALEGGEFYGAGNVAVTGGIVGGNASLTVRNLDKGPVPALEATAIAGTAEAKLLTKGLPDGQIYAVAENLGNADANGGEAPIRIEDVLPGGLKAVAVEGLQGGGGSGTQEGTCSIGGADTRTVVCTFSGVSHPYGVIELRISVNVEEGASSGESTVSISGGGAAQAKTISRPIQIGGEASFGLEENTLTPERIGGGPATQAGSHPFQVTSTMLLKQGILQSGDETPTGFAEVFPVALPKELAGLTPPGFLGNPGPFAQCTDQQFIIIALPGGGEGTRCPVSSVVGVATVTFDERATFGIETSTTPIFNMVPRFGEPAKFGFYVGPAPVTLDASLRSDGDYGVTVTSHNISQVVGLLRTSLTFWGVPGDSHHDGQRGYECLRNGAGSCPLVQPSNPPLLTMPTSCMGSWQASAQAASWAEPSNLLTSGLSEAVPGMDGCNLPAFAPRIEAEPTSDAATSPTGLAFDLDFENEGLTDSNEGATAESELKRAVVSLPRGFTTNPSVAAGLQACSLSEYEATTLEAGSGCRPESKVGEVEVESPLVENRTERVLKGGIYVARQGQNPNGNLLSLYLIAGSPELGVLVKQALKVTPDPVTGQLTTEVDNIPQLPFSHLRLSFRSGQRAPLITPPACGEYAVDAELYPWSAPSEPVHRESSFQITQGPEGGPCPSGGLPPFRPNLEAGTTNNAAGTYSPFYVHMTRRDSEQEITHFSIKLPPGVVGKLAGIGQCSDAQVAQAKAREHEGGGAEEEASPSCPASSEVGHTLVGTGVGNVLAYVPGKLYLGGPYHGSAISLVSRSPTPGSAPSTSAPWWCASPCGSTPKPRKSSSTPRAQTRSPTSSTASPSTSGTSAPTTTAPSSS